MYFTSYKSVGVTGLNRDAIHAYAEMEAGTDPQKALRDLGLMTQDRAYLEDRRSLLLDVRGMDKDAVLGTAYYNTLMTGPRRRVEQAIAYAHLKLHYLPKVENGTWAPDAGIQIPMTAENETEIAVQKEALHFAFALLLPQAVVRRDWKEGGVDALARLHKLPASFVEGRCRLMGLTDGH